MKYAFTKALLVTVAVLATENPCIALADEIHFACTLTSVDFMGNKPCTDDCRVISLAVDLRKNTVNVSSNKDEDGLFRAAVSDEAVEWDTELYHYQLNRYTTDLKQASAPKHGQQMLKIAFNFQCKIAQKQF